MMAKEAEELTMSFRLDPSLSFKDKLGPDTVWDIEALVLHKVVDELGERGELFETEEVIEIKHIT